MSNEQNIYDIVRLLKETVDSPITDESAEENTYGTEEQVSADELHETLKLKFSAENFEAEPEEKSPYDLDNDFLEAFSEVEAEEPVEETADPVEDTVEETAEEPEAPEEEAEEILIEENNEYIEELEVTDTEPEVDMSEGIFEAEQEEQLSLESEDEAVEHFEVDTEDYSDEVEELEEAPLTVEEIYEEEIKEIEKIAEAE